MISQVSFYHLTSVPLERALPRLLEKVYASGAKALLFFDDENTLKTIDDALWTYSQMDFLPHGTHHESYPEKQPIYLTMGNENPNNSDIVIKIGNTEHPLSASFKKIIDIFDGNDPQSVQNARERYKKYKDSGSPLVYWKQDSDGKWAQQ